MKVFNFRFITMAGLLCFGFVVQNCTGVDQESESDTPNFIIIFTDDLGYGDIGVFGHPTIRTPNLDRMAYEGQKWTQFYVTSSVCTPSRAGLMTGRLQIRSGMANGVLWPHSKGGLPPAEISIATALKDKNYRTAAVGKWHLGHKTPHLPTSHGFDSYYGIPYSNDMDRAAEYGGISGIILNKEVAAEENIAAFNVPLMRDEEIIEQPADQRTITRRFTEEAVEKIREFKGEPFFIYLAHSMPHVPLFRSADFKDVSLAGIYGDVIEEIDWSVGRILETLKEEGLDENTLVVFTSDNGHWHVHTTHAGTGGLLRGAKGSPFEGGMRVPTIFRWPGRIEPGVVMELGATLDLLPTFCKLAGIELRDDRQYDGYDISPALFDSGKSPRDIVYYYWGSEVFAIRKGDYKIHYKTREWGVPIEAHEPPLLYNLQVDPSEKYNIAENYPEIIEEMKIILEKHVEGIIPVEDQMIK